MLDPVGFQILLSPYEMEDKIGNIHVPDSVKDTAKIAATVCEVVATGPDAYADLGKFPNGPWCQQGDFVIIGKYAGSRFKYEDKEYRLLNDDQILAKVDDPQKVARIV